LGVSVFVDNKCDGYLLCVPRPSGISEGEVPRARPRKDGGEGSDGSEEIFKVDLVRAGEAIAFSDEIIRRWRGFMPLGRYNPTGAMWASLYCQGSVGLEVLAKKGHVMRGKVHGNGSAVDVGLFGGGGVAAANEVASDLGRGDGAVGGRDEKKADELGVGGVL
jgi:hypothetical protein